MATSLPIPKKRALQEVQEIIQYEFTDTALLWEALQAADLIVNSAGDPVPNDGNKRLALVGDAVNRLVLADDWYRSGKPRGNISNHTKVRMMNVVSLIRHLSLIPERFTSVLQSSSSNNFFDAVGKRLQLDKYVKIAAGQMTDPLGARTMSATVEAILGAVWYDGGWKNVKVVMNALGLDYTKPIRKTDGIGPNGLKADLEIDSG